MKKLLALSITLLLFVSCSLNDDVTNWGVDFLPVESVNNMPNEFVLGETYPITVSYFRPSTCHAFKEFYYLIENNVRIIAPIDYVFEDASCEALENVLAESTFNFIPTNNVTYTFKFWQGEDTNGEDQYLIIEVPVTN